MLRGASPVAAPSRCVLRRPLLVVDGDGRAVPRALALHLSDVRIREPLPVLDRIAATVERALQSLAVIGVAGHLASPTVCLVRDRLDFFQGERGLRDQLAIPVAPRTM